MNEKLLMKLMETMLELKAAITVNTEYVKTQIDATYKQLAWFELLNAQGQKMQKEQKETLIKKQKLTSKHVGEMFDKLLDVCGKKVAKTLLREYLPSPGKPAEVKKEDREVIIEKGIALINEKAKKEVEQETEEPEERIKITKINLELVRNLAIEINNEFGKKAVIDLLEEYSVKTINKLPENQYDNFLQSVDNYRTQYNMENENAQ